MLEQFKIAVYVIEHQVKTATEAATLADEYVLTHRSDRGCSPAEGRMWHTSTRWEERQRIHPGKHEYLGNQILPEFL